MTKLYMPQYILPYMKWTVLCNGIQVAEMNQSVPVTDGFSSYPMRVLGNGRYTSLATHFDLRFQSMNWTREGEFAIGQAILIIDGMPVSNWTPFSVFTGAEWPTQAPVALVHFLKDNRVWQGNEPTDEYERFSLMGEIVR